MATQAITGRMASRVTRTAWPAGVPEPKRLCNGEWLTPMWTPDKGWIMSMWCDDEYHVPVPRAQCSDLENCEAIHQEDHDEIMSKVRARNARWLRRKARACGLRVRILDSEGSARRDA